MITRYSVGDCVVYYMGKVIGGYAVLLPQHDILDVLRHGKRTPDAIGDLEAALRSGDAHRA